jgi:hypothetical protein
VWLNNGNELYLMAEQTGRTKLFIFSASPSSIDSMPHVISNKGCIEAAHPTAQATSSTTSFLSQRTVSLTTAFTVSLIPVSGKARFFSAP